jgi:hypothetical protein
MPASWRAIPKPGWPRSRRIRRRVAPGGAEAASPAYGSGVVYCDSGRGGAGIAVEPGGSGDDTRTHVKWRQERLSEGIGSPIIVDGLV